MNEVWRRVVLRSLGAGLVLLGCGTGDDPTGEGSSSGDGSSSSGGGAGSSSGGAGSSSGSASMGGSSSDGSSSSGEAVDDTSGSTGTPIDCEPASEWAAGGTASMTAQDCYPDPFAKGVPSCMLLCQTTAGPCTADAPERQDVSEGLAGLPVRLALQIVTAEDCEPVEGAFVEIWHTQRTGVYSGMTPSLEFCSGGDADAVNHLYFRGSQHTDAQGRVDFDTCYPGWYPGRAIHIHFRVVIDDAQYLVSQLFFDDGLNEEILSNHPDYGFGPPDTTNETDGIFGDVDDKAPYLLDVARMPDGAMLASKVIAIRSSTGDPLCSA